ncbi:MAG: prenyltransferase/squalene oxidase repeat-containing protein [Planctomycetota bacterium]
MRWLCVLLVVAASASAGDDRPMRWVKDKALQKQIHTAIDRGNEFLISIQKKDGHWSYHDTRMAAEPRGRAGQKPDLGRFQDPKKRREANAAIQTSAHDGGLTAAVLYAMGASGIKRDHPSLAAALKWIEAHPQFFRTGSAVGVYSSSLLVLALTRLDAKGFAPRIRELADTIAASQLRSGMWGYRLSKPKAYPQPGNALGTGQGDGSNTQLAVLALWAAHSLAGWEGSPAMWRRVEAHYRKTQKRSGAWGYRPGRGARMNTMTAAGVACYVYARAALDGGEVALQRARASATAQRGFKAHQQFMRKPNWHDYYLVYSIERVGTVLGLSDLSWYERGARVLIKRQDRKKGLWQGRSLGADSGHAYETALAILFLSRATYPPKKGATTPADRIDTISASEKVPMIAKAKSNARAFEIYLSLEPEARAQELRTIGARGAGMIDQLIVVLELDGRTPARLAALDALQRLLDKRFLYIAAAPPDERKVMADAIRTTWQRMRDGVAWDKDTGRYVSKKE